MQTIIARRLASIGLAAALVLASVYATDARRYRRERAEAPPLSASQSVDRADARIADLKVSLRLSDDQAKNWGNLQSALHDIAANRAKRFAGAGDAQTGRSTTEAAADIARRAAEEDIDVETLAQRDARENKRENTREDDIAAMQRRADTLAAQAADLRQIADAARPLYDQLDDRQRERLVQFVREDMRASETEDYRGQR